MRPPRLYADKNRGSISSFCIIVIGKCRSAGLTVASDVAYCRLVFIAKRGNGYFRKAEMHWFVNLKDAFDVDAREGEQESGEDCGRKKSLECEDGQQQETSPNDWPMCTTVST